MCVLEGVAGAEHEAFAPTHELQNCHRIFPSSHVSSSGVGLYHRRRACINTAIETIYRNYILSLSPDISVTGYLEGAGAEGVLLDFAGGGLG